MVGRRGTWCYCLMDKKLADRVGSGWKKFSTESTTPGKELDDRQKAERTSTDRDRTRLLDELGAFL
jgi:hypothetical protein